MITLVVIASSLFVALYLRRRAMLGDEHAFEEKLSNGAATGSQIWDYVLDQYGIPVAQFCIATIYALYMNLTVINLLVFAIKYLPTGLCMYKFIKSVYVTSRERLKQKQMELEDIQLQITIMNTKLGVREAECAERAAALRLEAARLRAARARVREAITADDSLRPAVQRREDASDRRTNADEPDLTDLLKDVKYERVALAERQNDMLECGEQAHFESPENSVYSSLSDADMKTDCRVKIVKVTNVYKVAYLKHYIKQKRLRRASKQALLKKKMESIKKLLEEWQKSLSMVINSKLSLLEGRADETSEEATGDHSKLLRDSDSDTDLRSADTCYEEYNASWLQPSNRNYYEFQEPETVVSRDFYESQEYGDKYAAQCECAGPKGGHVLFLLPRLPEETSSQVAVDEIKDDSDDFVHDGFLTV